MLQVHYIYIVFYNDNGLSIVFVFFSHYRHQLQQCHRSSDHFSTQQLPERLCEAGQSSGMGERVRHQSFPKNSVD